MLKKLSVKKTAAIVISAVLIIGIVIGGIFGGKAYSTNKASKPEITADNLAEAALFTKKDAEKTEEKGFKKLTIDKGEYVDIDFGKNVSFNSVLLEEKGDNTRLFRMYRFEKGKWVKFYEQDRILSYRLCKFEQFITSKLRIEMVECDAPVKINNLEIYYLEKTEPIKVSEYLSFGSENDIIHKRDTHDNGFSGNYDVVTDVIVFDALEIDKNANVVFRNGEKHFGYNLQALKEIIGERDVRIRATVFFDVKNEAGERDLNATAEFVNNNADKIAQNLKKVVEKYGLYGIDYDWEYPQTNKQWKAYGDLIVKTSEVTKVSVALPSWGIHLPKKAVKAIELVNVMTYDMFDERGDHSNIETGTVNAVKALLNAGFEKNQLLLGIPAYGRTADKSENAWPNYSGNEMKLGKFNKILKDYEYTDESGKKVKSDAYIQSYAEARDKTNFAAQTGCAGVMLFQAVCDSPYTYPYSLHRAIEEGMNGKIIKQ